MVFLADPSEIYRDSFLQAFAEFLAESDASARSATRGFSLKEATEHFEAFVSFLRDQADPMKVKPGWVEMICSSRNWSEKADVWLICSSFCKKPT